MVSITEFQTKIINYLLNIKLQVLVYELNTCPLLGEVVEIKDFFFTGPKLGVCHLYVCKSFNKQTNDIKSRISLTIKTERQTTEEIDFKDPNAKLDLLIQKLETICKKDVNEYKLESILKEIGCES
jgi:hypothetical protein